MDTKEVVYGPDVYRGKYKLPDGFKWHDKDKRIAVRIKDNKMFTAERDINVAHMWTFTDKLPPCSMQPSMRLILTEKF
jgi:hypothetical protein